jgi:hypothetical protein
MKPGFPRTGANRSVPGFGAPQDDLLLCGHHYRISRQALRTAGAHVENLPGQADAAAAALLEITHRDHAQVR